MVNPYLLNTGPRSAPKAQIQLSQSQAMKKFEKIQAKNSMSMEKRSGSFTKKSNKISFDSSKDDEEDDDDDDSDDEDSVFKNATKNSKRFMKKKKSSSSQQEPEPMARKSTNINQAKRFDDEEDDDEEDDEDIEISINERNNSRISSKNHPLKNRSGASSVSSMIATNDFQPQHRRSQSKVKFVADNINDYLSDNQESTIVEDLLSRNLVLDIDDLEPAMTNNSNKSPRKSSFRKQSKSPTAGNYHQKRSESAASIRSIIEEKENSSYSSLSPSIASPSILEANLIFDINDLEKNVNKVDDSKKKRSNKKSETASETEHTLKASKDNTSDSESSSESTISTRKSKKDKKKKDKEKEKEKEKRRKEKEKEKKKKEKEKEKRKKEKEKEKKLKEKEKQKKKKEKSISKKSSKSYSIIKTEQFTDTSIATDIVTDNPIDDDEEEIRTYKSETDEPSRSSRTSRTRRPTSRSSTIKQSETAITRSYFDDFETDQDVTLSTRPDSAKKKQLSFASEIKPTTRTRTSAILRDAEIQVNTNDLFKNSDLVRSLNIYNPSSILLSSLAQFDQVNLRDLNQITGYNMINHAFNDLFKANLNFIKNFLATQRNMYEIQMQSIQPK